jgi:hypothetical protein
LKQLWISMSESDHKLRLRDYAARFGPKIMAGGCSRGLPVICLLTHTTKDFDALAGLFAAAPAAQMDTLPAINLSLTSEM